MVIVEKYQFWLAVMALIVASWGMDVDTIGKLCYSTARVGGNALQK